MDLDLSTTRRRTVVIFVAAAVGVGAVIAGIVLGSTANSTTDHPEISSEAAAQDPRLTTWAETEPTRTVHVALTEGGPAWELERGGAPVALTPKIEDIAETRWTIDGVEGAHVAIGRAKLAESSPLTHRWTFGTHDPQVRWEVDVEKVSAERLTRSVRGRMVLPAGELLALDRGMRVRSIEEGARATFDAWSPTWFQWRGEGATLTFSDAYFDRVEVRREADAVTVDVWLWDPAAHPSFEACDEVALELQGAMTVTHGARPAVFPGRFRAGHRAMVAPVLLDPQRHEDANLALGRAHDAADWTRRIRTLAYGHSDEEDPRYGNGGLLGLGLGATVEVPERFRTHKEVRRMIASLEDTRLDLLAAEGDGAVNLAEGPRCDVDASRSYVLTSSCSGDGGDGYENLLSEAGSAPGLHAGLAAAIAPSCLDGRRRSVTEGMLSMLSLERLAAERGLALWRTPMVGTRNPLVGAAAEALLAPERYGHWTLEAETTAALGNVELVRETTRIGFTSVTDLVAHRRAMRGVRMHARPDGSIDILTADRPVDGLTIVAPRATEATVDGAAPRGFELEPDDHGSVAWIWWDAKASSSSRLALSYEGETYPVDSLAWSFEE